MEDRFEAFKQYRGKTSYKELGLDLPTPMDEEDNDSEWSHMSDYDDMGFAPSECGNQGGGGTLCRTT